MGIFPTLPSSNYVSPQLYIYFMETETDPALHSHAPNTVPGLWNLLSKYCGVIVNIVNIYTMLKRNPRVMVKMFMIFFITKDQCEITKKYFHKLFDTAFHLNL